MQGTTNNAGGVPAVFGCTLGVDGATGPLFVRTNTGISKAQYRLEPAPVPARQFRHF